MCLQVRQIVAFQAGDRHFAMNYIQFDYKVYASDGFTKLYYGKMPTADNGGFGAAAKTDKQMRFIRVTVSAAAAYYFGIGEIEVYEQEKRDVVTLTAKSEGETSVVLNWNTMVNGAGGKPSEVAVRRIMHKGTPPRDGYPVRTFVPQYFHFFPHFCLY